MKDNTQNPNISPFISDYLNEKGKLSELGIMLVVDALLLNREDQIPTPVLNHLSRNAEDQQKIMEYYAVMKEQNTAYLWAYPYLYPKTRRRSQLNRRNLYLSSSALLLTLVLGIYLTVFFSKSLHSQKIPTEAKSTVPVEKLPEFFAKLKPGFIAQDIQNRPLIVRRNEACSFELPNGSQIRIPAQTFVNQQGEIIQGDIEIKYREFHKALEILASGIPMRYDSAGVSYAFESAGMFEIRAYAEDKEVFIAPDKNIEVNMASFGEEEDFNHYYLKEEEGDQAQWELLEASKIRKKTIEREIIYTQNSPINTAVKTFPNKQEEAFEQSRIIIETPAFQIPFNLEKHPELKEISQKYWQWQDRGNLTENPFVNTWVLQEPWDEVDIKLLPQTRYDELNFSLPDSVSHVKFSADERFAVFSTHTGKATLLNLQSGKKITLPGAWTAIFSPDDQYILTTLDDVKLWSLEGKLLHNFGTPEYGVKSVAFSPDSKYLLITSKENQVRLYDIKGKFIARLWVGTEKYDYALSSFDLKNLSTEFAYFTEDSRYVLVKSTKGILKAWDVKGQEVDWNPKALSETFDELHLQEHSTDFPELYDFKVYRESGDLFSEDIRLLNLLTRDRAGILGKGFFSPKGSFLFTEKIISQGQDINNVKLWKISPERGKEEFYQMILKKNQTGVKNTFRMVVTQVNSLEDSVISEMAEVSRQAKSLQVNENKLLRVFEVKKLGIYNVDRIYDAPGMIALQADFRWDHSPKSLSFYPTVYQICGKNQNVVITYHALDWEDFRFDPEDRNYLLAILPDEKIAYFRPEDFAKLKLPEIQNQGKYTFRMHSRKFEGSQDELAQLLK